MSVEPAKTAEARPGGIAAGGAVSARVPYPRFLAHAAGILAALVAVGYLPTLNLGGAEAIPAMLAGCGLALAATLVGTVPLVLARDRRPQEAVPALLGSLALRLTVAIGLAVAAALSGLFPVVPLLVWLLVSHLGLLPADTHYALSYLRAPGDGRPPASSRHDGPRRDVPLEPVMEKR